MTATGLIPPHGGELVNLVVSGDQRTKLEQQARELLHIALPEREQCDLEMLAVGAMSPLKGFVGEADFHSICDNMKLTGGLPWSVPVTCSVDKATADKIKPGQPVALTDDKDRLLAVLTVSEKYAHDKRKECEKVYRTTEDAHPGVAVTMSQGDVCLAGALQVLTPALRAGFHQVSPDACADAGGVRRARLADRGGLPDA